MSNQQDRATPEASFESLHDLVSARRRLRDLLSAVSAVVHTPPADPADEVANALRQAFAPYAALYDEVADKHDRLAASIAVDKAGAVAVGVETELRTDASRRAENLAQRAPLAQAGRAYQPGPDHLVSASGAAPTLGQTCCAGVGVHTFDCPNA